MDALPFRYEDDPDAPGWKRWELPAGNKFNAFLGPLSVKVEDHIARVRMTPGERHSNLRGNVHGGALLGLIDVAMFAAARGFGVLTAGNIGEPVEAQVELLRETGRLLFLRGLIVQEAGTIASFAGTIRKPSGK